MSICLEINNINKCDWADFVKNHPQGNIFQSPEMYQVYQKTKNYEPVFLAVTDDKNEVLGTLLAVIQKEHGGFLGMFSARSIIIGGPLIKDNNLDVLSFILDAYEKEIKGKAIYTQIRNMFDQSWAKDLYASRFFQYEPHLDILHDLEKPVSEQFDSFHSGRKKNIRRAERAQLEFTELHTEAEFESALSLIEETYRRVKLPMPDKSLFLESYNQLKDNKIFKFFAAILDNEIIACRMVLCHNGMVYDWYAGASNNHLNKYPNDFLPWKVMEWGSLNGYKSFDFGGAGKPNVPYGVRDHKLKFGGELVEFGRFEKVHNKLLMNFGRVALKIFQWIK